MVSHLRVSLDTHAARGRPRKLSTISLHRHQENPWSAQANLRLLDRILVDQEAAELFFLDHPGDDLNVRSYFAISVER